MTSTAKEVGDEPLQIKLKYPNITVAVDEDRVNGSNELIYNFQKQTFSCSTMHFSIDI
jgi:tetraacyldisaccharide 4'-kinase